MHTFEGKAVRIHHNGDYSGNCFIYDKEKDIEIEIPCDDLLNFAAEYVRKKRLCEIENMDLEDLLK